MNDQQLQLRDSLTIAKDPSAKPELLEPLATHESVRVRAALASNPATPGASLTLLARDPLVAVRLAAAANTKTPEESLEQLANGTAEVCLVVVLNPQAPLSVLTTLAVHPDSQIRESVARNPNTPLDVLSTLAADKDPVVRLGVGANPVTPSALIAVMAKDGVTSLSELAKNVHMPADLLAELASNGDSLVRCSVARNQNTPIATLTNLAFDESRRVVESLARSPLAKPILLNILCEALTLEMPTDIHQLAITLGAPSAVTKMLEKSATDKTGLRRAIAYWTANPVKLEEMAKDPSPAVRLEVAANPNTPAAVLALFAEQDQNPKLLKVIAKNPNASKETLAICRGDYAHDSYAQYAREACSAQEALTIKVGDKPTVQAGPEGVWLTVKLWVSDSNAASVKPPVVPGNGLQQEEVLSSEPAAEPALVG